MLHTDKQTDKRRQKHIPPSGGQLHLGCTQLTYLYLIVRENLPSCKDCLVPLIMRH